MKWRAATVPLAAITAAIVLFSTGAWAQTAEEPSPNPNPSAEAEPEAPAPEPAEDTTGSVEEAPIEETPAEEAQANADRLGERSKQTKKAPNAARKTQMGPGVLFPTKVTLYSTPRVGKVGSRARVWGRATPEGQDRWIRIVNAQTGDKIKSVRTDDQGRFKAGFDLWKNTAVQAQWKAVKSRWRWFGAVPDLNVKMDDPLLFSKSKVRGRISRAAAGKWIKLKLRRTDTGRTLESRSVKASKSGHFKTRFGIKKPGIYRVAAAFDHEQWREAGAKTARKATPLPALGLGSEGSFVKALERRLARLGHHLGGINSYYGASTSDAIMAFNKVNGRARSYSVSSSTWRALAKAKRPKPRYSKPKFHIEVDQTRQVLFVVRNGKVKKILHVSTGAPSTPTYDGTYQFWGKIAGYSPNRLYYPSYFHGARAIHGWPEVPPYNASHGCVRVPMWAAKWIYAKIEVGDTIRVYH